MYIHNTTEYNTEHNTEIFVILRFQMPTEFFIINIIIALFEFNTLGIFIPVNIWVNSILVSFQLYISSLTGMM